MDRLDEFTEFAQARQGHLRRLAFLLCGDWHDAQDLTQTALLNLCLHWNKARQADAARRRGLVRRLRVEAAQVTPRSPRSPALVPTAGPNT